MRSTKRAQNLSGNRVVKYAVCCLALLLTFAPVALAGGFQLSVETPADKSNPQMKDAALVVRTFGCWQPADAALSATAEGLVNGKRQSLKLQLAPADKGVYTIKQQWPSEGFWVITISGEYNGMASNLLVELGPNGEVHPDTKLVEGSRTGTHVRGSNKKWAAADIDSTLKALANNTSAALEEPADAPTVTARPAAWFVAGLGAFLFLAGLVFTRRRARFASKQ
ncbi:MAG TPA: hypothetical protein VNN73_04970 [Blastocatellia bacterium]|nr:hypothetical protein [Blastocatellia bacterium]